MSLFGARTAAFVSAQQTHVVHPDLQHQSVKTMQSF